MAKLRDDKIGAVLDLSPALLFFGVETFTFHISPHAVCSAVRYRPTDRSRSRSTSLFFFATANVRDSTTSTTRNKLVKYDRFFFPISLVFAPQKQAWQMSQSPKTKVGIPLKRPRRKPERERKEEKSRNGGQSVRAAPNRNVGNGVTEDFFFLSFSARSGQIVIACEFAPLLLTGAQERFFFESHHPQMEIDKWENTLAGEMLLKFWTRSLFIEKNQKM